jgi:hypothetical protein
LVAYNLKLDGKIDIEIKSFSKEDIAVLSFLILHSTHTSKIAISLTLKKKEKIPFEICCQMNSNSSMCLRIDISEGFNILLNINMSEFQFVSRCNK